MKKINFTLYFLALVFSGTGAWIIGNYGYRLGLLDNPSDRSSHRTATPKGGGVGILIAFVFISLILKIPKSFWVPAFLLSLFSFWGDRFEIQAIIRLILQFMASIVLILGVFWSNQIQIASYFLIILLTVFIVGTTNLYNFMDGINGIAGITGVVGFGLLSYYAYISGHKASIFTLSICISLACLGFLPFNMPKARVFMGDVGSILIGFVFAGMVVWLSKSLLDFVSLAAFLFPFYADELTTMVVRLRDGESLLNPHRRHIYQLLANEYGIPHWKVSVGYGFTQLLIGVSILLIKDVGKLAVISALTFYFCGFIMLSFLIRKKIESH